MHPLLDLLDLLWPRHCLACAALLPSVPGGDRGSLWSGANAPPLCLCPACDARLVAIDPQSACRTCARPLASLAPITSLAPLVSLAPLSPSGPGPMPVRCGSCLADPPEFEALTALWRYEPPLRAVVEAFKFGRLDYLGAHFARALGRELGRRIAENGWVAPELVVPVPLPWPRRLARGFNQTELVAGPLARELDRTSPRLLGRRLFTPRQTGQRRSGRSRASNFRVRDPEAVAGRSILLIDDVLTTGSTVREASAALRRAGAGRIEVAVVAWTPLERPAMAVGRGSETVLSARLPEN